MGIYTSLYELCDFNDGDLLHFEQVSTPEEIGHPVVTTPHYADTIELVMVDGVEGIASIGGERFVFGPKCVLFVAPGAIHSMIYNSGGGKIVVAKLYTNVIQKYLNIDALLSADSKSLAAFSPLQSDYDGISSLLISITDCGKGIIEQAVGILGLFRLLEEKSADDSGKVPRQGETGNFALREIIDWTEANLSGHISLKSAAQKFGYSKNYFCERFRLATGVTYVTYLNLLRVSRSLALLAAGEPLSSICVACGFSNESYFIRLFKSTIGMTPACWRRQTRHEKNGLIG